MVAYVASPLSVFYKEGEDKGESVVLINTRAKLRAFDILSQCKRELKDYAPLSPVLCFMGVFDDVFEREEVFKKCIALLKKCDAFVYRQADLEISEGIKKELELAKEFGLKIYCL